MSCTTLDRLRLSVRLLFLIPDSEALRAIGEAADSIGLWSLSPEPELEPAAHP